MSDLTEIYTVTIEASGDDGRIWQTVHPAEYVTVFAHDEHIRNADDMAQVTAQNQNVADGDNWRVRVWEGDQADTGTTPAAEYYSK